MVYSYIRVSTDKQDYGNQEFAVLQYANKNGLGNVEFISETVSGKTPWRERGIAQLIDKLGKDDTIILAELSRLGRSIAEVLELTSILLKKGVEVHLIKESLVFKEESLQTKVFITMFSLCAEVERDLISQRTKEALASKEASSVRMVFLASTRKSRFYRYCVSP